MTNFSLCLPILLPVLFWALCLKKKLTESSYKKVYVLVLSLGILFACLNVTLLKSASLSFGLGGLSLFSLGTDPLSVIFVVLASILWIFVSIYAFGYFDENENTRRFFPFFLMAYAAVIGMSMSGNLITFIVFYELLTVSSFVMDIYNGTQESFTGAKKFMAYSLWSSLLVIAGTVLLYVKTGTVDFGFGGTLGDISSLGKFDLLIPYFLLFFGFGIKAALVPLHGWLPASMSAPTPVCALIMEVMTVKTAIMALVRITYYLYGWQVVDATVGNNTMLIFVLMNILLGSFLALHQQNLKKRLAYSTISQLGYIMLCLVIFDRDIFTGSMLHLIFHGLNKAILFLCIGNVVHATGKTEISQIAGVGKQMPKTMICFTIAAFSLIGIPPANGFTSKWYIAVGGIGLGKFFVPVFLLLSALLTAEYLVPVIAEAFFKGDKDREPDFREPNNKMLMAIICLTVISVLTGIFPNPTINLIQNAAEALF